MAGKQVQILGLKELRRDLMRLDNVNVPKAMVAAGTEAITPILNAVRAALPKRSGNLASSIRAAKIRTGGSYRVGTARFPYVGPYEFGGYPGARLFVRDGRKIFPITRQMAPAATEIYSRLIQRAIDTNGWEEVLK